MRKVAALQLFLSGLLLGGVWVALPARWIWVDVPATLLGVGCAVVAVGLGTRAPWGRPLARIWLWLELALGSTCISLLALSAAQLAGSYGPVGAGGALLMLTVALLIIPYLVVFPALQLSWLRKLG